MYREAKVVAAKIGVGEGDVVALAKDAAVRHKRSVAWIRMSITVDGAIEVGLADKPGSPHGIVVFFQPVNGSWQEVPALQMPWII